MTKLEAVNYMLNVCAYDTLSSLEASPLPREASQALFILNNLTKEKLQDGWYFNTEDYTLPRTSENKVVVPAGVLRIVAYDYNVVPKGGLLYDKDEQSYVFEEDLEVELVLNTDFEDIPVALQSYLMYQSTLEFAQAELGNQAIPAYLADRARDAWRDAKAEETETGQYNIFTNTFIAGVVRRP